MLGLQLSEEVQVVNQLIDARDAHRGTECCVSARVYSKWLGQLTRIRTVRNEYLPTYVAILAICVVEQV